MLSSPWVSHLHLQSGPSPRKKTFQSSCRCHLTAATQKVTTVVSKNKNFKLFSTLSFLSVFVKIIHYVRPVKLSANTPLRFKFANCYQVCQPLVLSECLEPIIDYYIKLISCHSQQGFCHLPDSSSSAYDTTVLNISRVLKEQIWQLPLIVS